MQLERIDSGHLLLKGAVNFNNAVEVEREGKLLMTADLAAVDTVRISLVELVKADSATLSLCLSWIRYAAKFDAALCFSDIPCELLALARVSGLDGILQESTCPV